MISFNLPRTLRDEEEGIDTPLARQGHELVCTAALPARIRSRNGPFPPDTLPAFLPLRAAAPLTSPHDGPLRWNASGGLRNLVERQREWPHEAEARFALVVHARPAAAAPRRSLRRFWP